MHGATHIKTKTIKFRFLNCTSERKRKWKKRIHFKKLYYKWQENFETKISARCSRKHQHEFLLVSCEELQRSRENDYICNNWCTEHKHLSKFCILYTVTVFVIAGDACRIENALWFRTSIRKTKEWKHAWPHLL
jgi:hypothetical protein